MKLLILSSCTGEKAVEHPAALTIDDFRAGPEHVSQREAELSDLLTPAEDLYTGQQHVRLMRGINKARQAEGFEVDLKILSAGYGLVDGSQLLAPYETTFSGMKKKALREWAQHLAVPTAVRTALSQPYDLALVLLGNDYLAACELNKGMSFGGPVVFFCGKAAAPKLPLGNDVHSVVLQNADARRFSCGLVGLKGEVAGRLLESLVGQPEQFTEFLNNPVSVIDQLAQPPNNRTAVRPTKRSSRANAEVDQVIRVPDSWWQLPHKKKLRYFIPEWDDLVDPEYGFLNDTHSGGMGDWSNEVYAHQMFDEPNYDGLLVSRVVAEKSKKKAERINQMGIHRYLRVPDSFPIMGDCGAFGYLMEDEPPFSTDDLMKYYTDWGFNYGVSIDHLIVKATMHQAQDRYDLTIDKAAEFIKEHSKRGLTWTPIGAVQGWDPESYANMAKHHFQVGYDYIALGGLVRSTSDQILGILREVRKVVPNRPVNIHLFGVSRPDAIQAFSDAGATSVDSASYLRQAWVDARNNYHTLDRTYCALRIPEVGKSFRSKRAIAEGRLDEKQARKLERKALDTVRALDQGAASADTALNAICEYDAYITDERVDRSRHFKDTLVDRPWQHCPCSICRKAGVETVIFRGNNRNRRRGFHNTFIFYQMIQKIFAGESVPAFDAKIQSRQLSLLDEYEVR